MNVFVFPTRNEPGLEAVQALSKSNKITLFGGSSYEKVHDPARHLLTNYVLCPGYDEPDFVPRFQSILREHAIDIVLPAWDRLVAVFSQWTMEGVTFVTPRAEIATMLLSKRKTYERLKGSVPVPRVYKPEDASLPVFAKPDVASGSVGGMHVTTESQLAAAVEKGLLLSEYLPGDEFTVDCISDRQGVLLFANQRARSRIGQGISLGTCSVHDPRVAMHVEAIAATLRIEGPWFAQFKCNEAGEPVLMEINPRLGGSSAQTRLSGVNIPLISVFLFAGYPVRIPRLRSDVLLNRSMRNYTDAEAFDWVIWDWDDTLIRRDGRPDPDAMGCLYDLRNRGIRQALFTRNPEAESLMNVHMVPRMFEEIRVTDDKVGALKEFMARRSIDASRLVMVNDSFQELFEIQDSLPQVRTVTPDALETLGRAPLT
ncbi:MAG: ATP-grasp domain-containing protein [Candidatus Hydrogenedentes bacterium]|nr:ATP-grasp domain-containing protein [Candidatus Hydrogenedentota bacterium]